MPMSNKPIQIKPAILSIKKKTRYYFNKKISKNTKKYTTPSFN